MSASRIFHHPVGSVLLLSPHSLIFLSFFETRATTDTNSDSRGMSCPWASAIRTISSHFLYYFLLSSVVFFSPFSFFFLSIFFSSFLLLWFDMFQDTSRGLQLLMPQDRPHPSLSSRSLYVFICSLLACLFLYIFIYFCTLYYFSFLLLLFTITNLNSFRHLLGPMGCIRSRLEVYK